MLVICTYFCSALLCFFLVTNYEVIFCSAGLLEITVTAILISNFSYCWSTLCDYEYASVDHDRGNYTKVSVSWTINYIKIPFFLPITLGNFDTQLLPS